MLITKSSHWPSHGRSHLFLVSCVIVLLASLQWVTSCESFVVPASSSSSPALSPSSYIRTRTSLPRPRLAAQRINYNNLLHRKERANKRDSFRLLSEINGGASTNNNDGRRDVLRPLADLLDVSDKHRPHDVSNSVNKYDVATGRWIDWYSHKLVQAPILTKMITSGLIAVVGDLIAQLADLSSKIEFTELLQSLNIRRLVEFFLVNSLFIGPALHYWFNLLNTLPIPTWASFHAYAKAAYLIFVDQTIGAVGITTAFFVVYEIIHKLFDTLINAANLTVSLSPHSAGQWLNELLSSIQSALGQHLWPTLVAGRKFWPMVNFANLLFVPLQYRVLVASVMSTFWNIFLSALLNS